MLDFIGITVVTLAGIRLSGTQALRKFPKPEILERQKRKGNKKKIAAVRTELRGPKTFTIIKRYIAASYLMAYLVMPDLQ